MKNNIINEIETAREKYYIKGVLARRGSLWKYIIRAIIIPLISIFNIQITFLLGGTIIIERIFNWNGIGYLSWDAAVNHDYPLLMAIIFFTSIFVRGLEIVNKIMIYFLEPRLRT